MGKKVNSWKVGEVVSGTEILEIKPGVPINGKRLHQDTQYLLKYLCCGEHTAWVSHKGMMLRVSHGRTSCRRCAGKHAAKKRAEMERKKKEQKEESGRVFVPGWGYTITSQDFRSWDHVFR